MNNKLILFTTVIFILSVFTSARSQKIGDDISGMWVINTEKSDFGIFTPEKGAAKEIKITLKKDSMEAERKFASSISKDSHKYDGTPSMQELPDHTKKTSTFKWIDKGRRFIVNSTYEVDNNGNPWQYKRTETYSLSEDSKFMLVERVTVIPDQTAVVKAVYERK